MLKEFRKECEKAKKQMIEWLDEISNNRGKNIYKLSEDEIDNTYCINVELYTDNHCYSIGTIFKFNKLIEDGYLGCIAHCRKKRAGEKDFRGNDLPDGCFNSNTWINILKGIVRYELVPLAMPVTSEEKHEQCN